MDCRKVGGEFKMACCCCCYVISWCTRSLTLGWRHVVYFNMGVLLSFFYSVYYCFHLLGFIF